MMSDPIRKEEARYSSYVWYQGSQPLILFTGVTLGAKVLN